MIPEGFMREDLGTVRLEHSDINATAFERPVFLCFSNLAMTLIMNLGELTGQIPHPSDGWKTGLPEN